MIATVAVGQHSYDAANGRSRKSPVDRRDGEGGDAAGAGAAGGMLGAEKGTELAVVRLLGQGLPSAREREVAGQPPQEKWQSGQARMALL